MEVLWEWRLFAKTPVGFLQLNQQTKKDEW